MQFFPCSIGDGKRGVNGTCSKCSFQGWKPQVMKGCFNFPKVVCWSRYQWCHVHPFFWASFPDEHVVNIAHYLVLPFIWMKSSMTVKGSSRVWDTTGTHTIWQCKTPAAAFPFPKPLPGFLACQSSCFTSGFLWCNQKSVEMENTVLTYPYFARL